MSGTAHATVIKEEHQMQRRGRDWDELSLEMPFGIVDHPYLSRIPTFPFHFLFHSSLVFSFECALVF